MLVLSVYGDGRPGMIRTLAFDSGGTTCAAAFYRSAGTGRRPCLVMGHGFTGTQDQLSRYGAAFAEHGLNVLTFDYRHFGTSGGQPRQVVDVTEQLEDFQRAVTLARSLPEVDPEAIGLWGSSFSAGHVLMVAVGDPWIRAVVVQIPEFGMGSGSVLDEIRNRRDRKNVPLTAILRTGIGLLLAAARDELRARRALSPLYLPVFVPPGQVGAVIDAHYDRFLARATETGATWRNEFAPRLFFRPPRYRRGTAERLTSPLLACLAGDDTETNPLAAASIVRAAPRGEFRTYQAGHFDIYEDPLQETIINDQARFLREHLMQNTKDPAP
jgi:fermentation-respiration switch protein FrsA (DUF1100 family)